MYVCVIRGKVAFKKREKQEVEIIRIKVERNRHRGRQAEIKGEVMFPLNQSVMLK